MSQPRQHQLRPPRRPPLGPRDRGRLLRQPAGAAPQPRRDRPRRRRSSTSTSAPMRARARLPGRVGGGLADALGGPAALPQLRVGDRRRCSTRTPSTASTRSSTAAPRRSSATSSASRGPTWRRRSSASPARSTPTPSGRWTSRRLRRTGRRPSRPPAPAPRAARPAARGSSAFAAATISSASVARRSSTPVAAIASHTASACSGVRTARRSSARQRRIALAREDQRQRDRAVQQVGAAVLAGPLGRPGDVEHVVEQLEGEPDAAAEVARARPPSPAALQRAEPARRLEQPRGLEVAAAQVALARDVDVPGVLALQQLALGQRRGRVGQHADLVRRARWRASSANARENSRSPVAVAIARPAVATTVGRPRRSAAASSTSSCTSVAEWISSTATAARSDAVGVGPRRSPAARKTSSGRSRLPPARIVAPACSASSAPCEVASASRRSSRRAISAGTCAPPASTSASTCSALLTRTVPDVEGDDAAGGEDPADVAEPGGRHAAPASASGPGKRLTELGRYA